MSIKKPDIFHQIDLFTLQSIIILFMTLQTWYIIQYDKFQQIATIHAKLVKFIVWLYW